jgi:hypothetical protein
MSGFSSLFFFLLIIKEKRVNRGGKQHSVVKKPVEPKDGHVEKRHKSVDMSFLENQ